MQKYVFHTDGFGIAAGVWIDPHVKDGTELYVASEVDALVADLKNALREAMGWNWLDEDNPPPKDVVDQCNRALMVRGSHD